MSEYIAFVLTKDTGKTRAYDVVSKRNGDTLAVVKWYGPWRQYTMFPAPHTVWNIECLAAVNRFIGDLMLERAYG